MVSLFEVWVGRYPEYLSEEQAVRFWGCHVSAAGGLARALENGQELCVNTIQLHPFPPQQWNRSPFKAGMEREFIALRSKSGISRVFFHAIYLVNLAGKNGRILSLSKRSLLYYLDLSARIKGDGVIVHVGSAKEWGSKEDSLEQASAHIDWILERAPKKTKLILELSAGSGQVIGSRLEDLDYLYRRSRYKTKLGFALDTQHLWASGYDIKEDQTSIIKRIGEVLGYENIMAIHVNDSKSALGSRVDRHENLGQGLIGQNALKGFITRPVFKSIPLILETPRLKTLDGARSELKVLRRMLGQNP